MAWSAAHLSEIAGLFAWELAARRRLGSLAVARREKEEAVRQFARASLLAATLDSPLENCRLQLAMAWERRWAHDFTKALLLAREGIEIARTSGLEPLVGEFLLLVGVVEGAEKNPRKNFLRALGCFEQALALSEARRLPRLRWEILLAMAALYRERGKGDLAEEYEERAEEVEQLAFRQASRKLRGLCWKARIGDSLRGREAVSLTRSPE
jgi:tetratricopeptide (TPR) repeat protein